MTRCSVRRASGTGRFSQRGNTVYFWQLIHSKELIFGGFLSRVKSIRVLPSGKELSFRQDDRQIVVEMPEESIQDPIANVTVYALEFEEPPRHRHCAAYPQLQVGEKLV
jgi:hypothetical protein